MLHRNQLGPNHGYDLPVLNVKQQFIPIFVGELHKAGHGNNMTLPLVFPSAGFGQYKAFRVIPTIE
jgi:hypothetical protein